MNLKDRSVVLAVSGGIAAYKAAELVRALRQAGARVRVVFEPTEKERRLHVAESTVPYGAKWRKSKRGSARSRQF